MAEITLTETFKKDGALIDVTSSKLSDPTGTYGVKRNDTDAVIVADDTAMTKVSTGVYNYSFDEPEGETGLTYTYWVEWVYEGRTYRTEHQAIGAVEDDLASIRLFNKYASWIAGEFLPLTLITPTATLKQLLENAIRYWNTHSGHKVSTMVTYAPGTKRAQLPAEIKYVTTVFPSKTTTWIWNDHPLWTLLGITVMDSVTTDLIMMSEAFRNYRIYVGTDFRWVWEKSDDPTVGGYLYCVNVPSGSVSLYVIGTKRITKTENIKDEYILDWLLSYWKALIKQVEGNTLRKSGIIDIKNDGQALIEEGREDMQSLQDSLKRDSRWVVLAKRY